MAGSTPATGKPRVRALYSYSYEDDNGHQITMKEGEEFYLIKKTNDQWWNVKKIGKKQGIYVPANYVELVSESDDDAFEDAQDSFKVDDKRSQDSPKLQSADTICVKTGSFQVKEQNRLSTFGAKSSAKQPSSASGSSRGDPDSDPGLLTPDEDGAEDVSGTNSQRPKQYMRAHSTSDSGTMPEYANLDEYRQAAGIPVQSPPGAQQTQPTHTDQSHEYMNLADIQAHIQSKTSPDPPPPPKPGKSMAVKTFSDGWEMHIDPSKNRPFYYNKLTSETSWKPPRFSPKKEESDKMEESSIKSPDARDTTTNGVPQGVDANGRPLPPGWVVELGENDEKQYINTSTEEHWFSSVDATGKTYYYKQNSSESMWELPEVEPVRHNSIDSAIRELEESFKKELQDILQGPGHDLLQVPGPDGTSSVIIKPSGKKGPLNKTKIMEAGKKLTKKWSQTYVVLSGSTLYFYKDAKAAQKSPQGKPESVIDMSTAEIDWGNKETSSRKNVLQIISDGAVYLLQADDGTKIQEWNIALKQAQEFASQLADKLPPPESSKPPSKAPPPVSKMKRSKSTKIKGVEESTQPRTKIRERLMNLLVRRPTRDSLAEKGIIKQHIFGSTIAEICDRENSTIPRFVMDCTAAIESRGLACDGIYRLSGNLAQVQKLRFAVDSGEPYNLNDPQWDFHVLTGALKLFFRELKEPLFPFECYDKFKFAISMPLERSKRAQAIKDLVKVLPKVNFDTTKLLFRHLNDVMSYSSQNRMQAQNIAIVFGPTLLWPKDEVPNMAVSTVFQNQIVECVLLDYKLIFS